MSVDACCIYSVDFSLNVRVVECKNTNIYIYKSQLATVGFFFLHH